MSYIETIWVFEYDSHVSYTYAICIHDWCFFFLFKYLCFQFKQTHIHSKKTIRNLIGRKTMDERRMTNDITTKANINRIQVNALPNVYQQFILEMNKCKKKKERKIRISKTMYHSFLKTLFTVFSQKVRDKKIFVFFILFLRMLLFLNHHFCWSSVKSSFYNAKFVKF